ncbi:YitT family protein [Lacticaseibacillus baoqingensis]|uniref:YitT family protein n=1 Tax=Lacticaseibacillus baoqingensis TaxID=2486013 RepID=A0ABW4E2N2_9LACO|nr:YitT family protein [Lacticaseibacillus baoqingensis]
MQKFFRTPLGRGSLMLLALGLIAVSINWFYAPHGVAAGGATGIAILVQEAFQVPVGVTTLAVNVIMLALAWWLLDQATTRRILIGSLVLPLMLAVIPQVQIVSDRLLAVIVGSVLFAIGVAINYRIDASSGGTTVPPLIFKRYFGLKPAIGLFAIDMVVCVFNIFVSGVEAFILAVLAIALTSLVMTYVETGFDRKKAVYIMSSELALIKTAIRDQSDYGLTVHSVVGGYSGQAMEMLMVVVEQPDFKHLIDNVHRLDPAAFILATEATEVHGGSLG